MSLRDWFRPPRHLLVLFLALTIVPTLLLAGLGWEWWKQDRELDRQRRSDRLIADVSRLTIQLSRELDGIEAALPMWVSSPPPALMHSGALVARLDDDGVIERAGTPLAFEPIRYPPDPPESTWQAGETLEIRQQNYAGAIGIYRALTSAPDPRVQAGASIRLARTLRKLGRIDEALSTYKALSQTSGVAVLGQPVDLLSRMTQWRLMKATGEASHQSQEASALANDLITGRWHLDRSTYLSSITELGLDPSSVALEGEHRALAEAVTDFWLARPPGATANPSWRGRESRWSLDRDVLLLWRVDQGNVLVFAASPRYVDAELGAAWRTLPIAVSVLDRNGRRVAGEEVVGPQAVLREEIDTTLPWTLRVAAVAAAQTATFGRGQELIVAALALIVFFVPAAGFIVARAVQRDLAVARLQADFVSAVSHEFRTPLTSMRHLVDLLRGPLPLTDARKREYFDVLARDNERLRRFVETLLDFGRMEAGTVQYRREVVTLPALVSEVADDFRSDPALARHPLTISTNEPLPRVAVDRDAFGRALWNLLDNAAKYSEPEAPIDVSLSRDADRVLVHVRDRGCGIAPEDQKRVFAKFVRGPEAATSDVKGTGVGLALIDHIVRGHGGEVRLVSEIGQGSTFTIVLPLAPVDERA